jgi:hypothetical protein
MKSKVFRPHLDDVERLSYGKGAKKQRGTGSKYVCHRLNRDERKIYDLAKKASPSFLTVRGTGYRKERKGSPLCNIFRQRCDALEELCVVIEKRSDQDSLVIDFSTLRVRDDQIFVSSILENVLKAKYRDLYDLVVRKCEEEQDLDLGGSGDISSAIFRTPIHWETVKTQPIWAVDERLITIPCDRDVAKFLAVDVLKESSNFMFDDTRIDTVDNNNEEMIEKTTTVQSQDEDVVITRSAAKDDNDDDDSIDWNDI